MDDFLSIKNIETYYDRILALRGVSLTVARYTITTILGNNGAGKTTVLNSIMGLVEDQPDKGSIEFQGIRLINRNPEWIVKQGISYVPEGREVFEELSVLENLQVGAYLRGGKAYSRNMERVMSFFPVLGDRRKQRAGTLSGGEQQMLAIGRALMNEPQLLLLDEPSLGLSPVLVSQIFEIIEQINQEGVTILLIEQNAQMALNIADYGYVLENGRFVASGSSGQLKENQDVKEFYLGIKTDQPVKGYQRFKRKKRWS